MVYSIGSNRKVTGEILCRDSVRDRSRIWIIQSGSHETVPKIMIGINLGTSHADQGNLYSPTNVIAIRRYCVTLDSILENDVN